MKFTCTSGQRPLDGFTLKRGIGTGGFGEVYYALSDGGKEVALKLVRGHQDIELRGIAQCLNLKHAHLVSLFDLRTDAEGDHWVVMEYITGEPLSAVLNRHPQGLPRELVPQWFSMLARAVGCLHDHGIVHRDLKPGNIFIENGILKVGDYGLSKFISCSARTAQTQSVGTVYYMAPEISTGNYNKQIDIYAAGIILYEMLTGRVPFEGESAGEILMKHLTSPPDLTKLPAEYVPVVGKALAKNPAQRYATIGEMAREVEVLHAPKPAPNGQAVDPAANGKSPASPVAIARTFPQAEGIVNALPASVSLRAHAAELSGSMVLAVVLSGLLGILYAALANTFGHRVTAWYEVGYPFFLTVAICWAVMVPAKFWNQHKGDSLLRRLGMMVLGGLIGLGALWLNGWLLGSRVAMQYDGPVPRILLPAGDISVLAGYLSYFGLAFCALRWWRLADSRRSARFSLFPVLAAGFWALILSPLIAPVGLSLKVPGAEPPYAAIALVAAAIVIQWVSPWEQPAPPPSKRLRLRYA